jgi:aminomethyltransferase
MVRRAPESEIKATALHLRTAAANRFNLWRPWLGYTVPATCRGVIIEYAAARHGVALADVSPLVVYRILGEEAATYLSRLLTKNIEALEPGRAADVLWCDDSGRVRGQGLLVRRIAREFLLVTEVRDLPWLLESSFGFDVTVVDTSGEFASLALIGPQASAVLVAAGVEQAGNLDDFGVLNTTVRGLSLSIARTGPDGRFMLWATPDDAVLIWDALMRAGKNFAIEPMGFDTYELLRIEAGLPAIGRDYFPAHLAVDDDVTATPMGLGLDHLIDFERAHFNGRRALLMLRGQPVTKRLVKLVIDGEGDASFGKVYGAGRELGSVTSAARSPGLNAIVALAWIEAVPFKNGQLMQVAVTKVQNLKRIETRLSAHVGI